MYTYTYTHFKTKKSSNIVIMALQYISILRYIKYIQYKSTRFKKNQTFICYLIWREIVEVSTRGYTCVYAYVCVCIYTYTYSCIYHYL